MGLNVFFQFKEGLVNLFRLLIIGLVTITYNCYAKPDYQTFFDVPSGKYQIVYKKDYEIGDKLLCEAKINSYAFDADWFPSYILKLENSQNDEHLRVLTMLDVPNEQYGFYFDRIVGERIVQTELIMNKPMKADIFELSLAYYKGTLNVEANYNSGESVRVGSFDFPSFKPTTWTLQVSGIKGATFCQLYSRVNRN